MRRELIPLTEPIAQLREHGVGTLEEAKLACMEGTGQISVVIRDAEGANLMDRTIVRVRPTDGEWQIERMGHG